MTNLSNTPRRLYVQCNPLLDISATVDGDFMKKYKLQKGSAALVADWQMGIYAQLQQQPNVVYVPGGAGLNTARVAQWISRAPKSSFATFVGCIADDKHGKMLKEAAQSDGVVMEVQYNNTAPTGTCAVCLCDKQRSLVANLGAARLLSDAHMHSSGVLRALQECEIFYFTGFTLTVNVEYVLQAAKAVRSHNGVFTFNISAPYIVQIFEKQMKAVLPYIDILFANETQAKTLAKMYGWIGSDDDEISVVEIAQKAATELPYNGTFDRLVVFTQGCLPTVFATRSGKCGEVSVTPVPKELMVDTNAGGDAFVGGFLAAFALNKDIRRCCEVGNYAGAEIIQHDGCTFPEIPKIIP